MNHNKQLVSLMESVVDIVYDGQSQLGPRPSKSELRVRRKLKRLQELERNDPDKRFGAVLRELQEQLLNEILTKE